MPNYALSASADRDLTEIYRYSYAEFGELQADAYFESLDDCLTTLGENPELGRDVGLLRAGYRVFVHKRHSIYYTKTRSGIFVVRVLGPGMELQRNLW